MGYSRPGVGSPQYRESLNGNSQANRSSETQSQESAGSAPQEKAATVACPYCKAAAGAPCVTKDGAPVSGFHAARRKAVEGK